MTNKSKINIIAIVVIIIAIFGIFSPTGSDKKEKTTKSEKTEKVAKKDNETSFASQVKKTAVFDDVELDAENNIYIVSKNLGMTFGDKKAIEFFNSDIKQLLDKGINSDKPVVFRGWFDNNGSTVPGSIIYFSKDNYNQDWGSQTILDTDTYKYSDGWISASKFGQYQTSNHEFKDNSMSDLLNNIFQSTK